VKQTHNAVLIVKRTSLYDWADKNLNQSASGGIDHGTEQNSCIGIWQNIGQKGKSNQAAGGKNLRSNDTPTITDFIDISGTEQIDKKLCEKEYCRDKRNFSKLRP
jgi:hypothetical protein